MPVSMTDTSEQTNRYWAAERGRSNCQDLWMKIF
jgi:hypothetical protein